MSEPRTIDLLVAAAGGPLAIEAEAKRRGLKLTKWAVYKWPTIGIPQKHWPLMKELAEAEPSEIYEANQQAAA